MHSSNFFEWLGSMLGTLIRTIVDALRYLLKGLSRAIGDFVAGLAHAMGISPSTFNVAWLVLGLLFLYVAVRAFLRRSIVAGILWLVIAVLVLGRLIH
jgi:hypothetical protein